MARASITNILIALCSVLITLLLCEVIARSILPAHPTIRIEASNKTFSDTPAKQVEDSTGSIMQVMDWSGSHGVRLNPNVTALIKSHTLSKNDITIRTNSYGLRYPPIPSVKGKEKRVLFIGDSITFGDYVQEEKTIPNLLESLLSKTNSPAPLVINAGLPGANTLDEFHHYLELSDSIKPDLVLIGMYLNDSQESQNFYAQKLRFPLSHSRFLSFVNDRLQILAKESLFTSVQNSSIDPEWREQFKGGRSLGPGDMLQSRDAFDFEIYNAHKDFGLAWNAQSWENLRKITETFSQTVTARGSQFAIVLFPVHFQVYSNPEVLNDFPQEKFKEMCESLNVPCLDLLPSLRSAASNGVLLDQMYYDHCHFKEEGNLLVATTIKEWLLNNTLLTR